MGEARGREDRKVNTWVMESINFSLGLAVSGYHPGRKRTRTISHQRTAEVSTPKGGVSCFPGSANSL